MNRCVLICLWRSKCRQRGFILVDLLLALAVAGVLLTAVISCVERACASLAQLEDDIRLTEGRRHILTQLEKTLGYDVVQLTVSEDARLSCITITANKKLVIYCDKNVLYQKTTTGEGSGINPLSLEETKLTNWQVKPAAGNRLRVSFTLSSAKHKLDVVQFITCYNARVEDDA